MAYTTHQLFLLLLKRRESLPAAHTTYWSQLNRSFRKLWFRPNRECFEHSLSYSHFLIFLQWLMSPSSHLNCILYAFHKSFIVTLKFRSDVFSLVLSCNTLYKNRYLFRIGAKIVLKLKEKIKNFEIRQSVNELGSLLKKVSPFVWSKTSSER